MPEKTCACVKKKEPVRPRLSQRVHTGSMAIILFYNRKYKQCIPENKLFLRISHTNVAPRFRHARITVLVDVHARRIVLQYV